MKKMKIAISAAVAVLSMSLFIGFTGNTAQINEATSGSSFTVTTYEYVYEGCSSSTGNRSGYGINYGISSDPKFTKVPCKAKWFSAADFKVEKKEELKNEELQ